MNKDETDKYLQEYDFWRTASSGDGSWATYYNQNMSIHCEIRFDEQTVPGTSVADLAPKLWNRFRTVLSPTDDLEFLEKMKLVAKDGEGTTRATVGGILMASENPNNSSKTCPVFGHAASRKSIGLFI